MPNSAKVGGRDPRADVLRRADESYRFAVSRMSLKELLHDLSCNISNRTREIAQAELDTRIREREASRNAS